jgi:hypothetical protein
MSVIKTLFGEEAEEYCNKKLKLRNLEADVAKKRENAFSYIEVYHSMYAKEGFTQAASFAGQIMLNTNTTYQNSRTEMENFQKEIDSMLPANGTFGRKITRAAVALGII